MSEKTTTSQPGTIDELKPDNKNFNKHTEYGMALLEKSLRQNGAGRSILVDKDDNIIAGNGIVEAAQNAGITKTRVVEVTGDELVVVKRTDLALDSKQGREMALADNATAAVDLAWDADTLTEVAAEYDFAPEDWGVVLDADFDTPQDDDKAEVATGLQYLKFGNYKITIENDELELLNDAIKVYSEKYNSYVGFVRDLWKQLDLKK